MSEQESEEATQLGRLLTYVSKEFQHCTITPVEADRAVFASKKPKVQFEAVEVLRKQFLGRTEECVFEMRVADNLEDSAESIEIHLNHTGHRSRTGVAAKVKKGGAAAQEVADRILADKKFVDAMMPLDSKYLHILKDNEGWFVRTGQVGAAWLLLRLPPIRRYIPMGHDQVKTLIHTLHRLSALLTS